MLLEGLALKPFDGSQIARLAEPELDRVAVAVDGSVEIRPASSNLDVCFIDIPFSANCTLPEVETVEQLG
jgi:hypothetical protein